MSFARNFAAGQEIAQRGIDTYRDAKQRRALGRVADAKPEESQGYTAQDGEHLSAIANAKDADGNPYYSVEPGANGGYGVRSNFQVQGDDGSMGTPGMAPMGPRTVTDFLGQRTEGSLSAGGIDAARGRAYADVISSTDPVKGLQMRRDAATMERENARFQAEEEMRPLQRRAAELQVSGGERNERVGVRSDLLTTIDDQIAQMPDDALKVYASQVNTNNTDLPMLFIGKTKDGFQFLSRDPKTGEPGTKPMTYSAAQMRDLARVSIYASAGFGKESQTLLKETSKELYDMLYKDAQLTETTVRSGNDALGKQTGLEIDRAKLADAQRRTGIAASTASRQAEQDRLGRLIPVVGADGQPGFGEAAMVSGQPTIRPVNVTGGIKIPGAGPTRTQEAALKTYYEQVALNPQAPQRERDMLADQLGVRSFVGGSGGLSFNGPAQNGAPPAAPDAPVKNTQSTKTPTAPATGEQRVRELYDKWQAAKGPWYMPTPRGNREVEAAEREYEQAYQQFLRSNQR